MRHLSSKLFLIAFPLLMFSFCVKDNVDVNEPGDVSGNVTGGKGNISFVVGIANGTRVSTDADFRSSWEDGDEIGIFAVKRTSGGSGTLAASGNYIHNVRLTYDSGDETWSPDDGVKLTFPDDGGVLDFYAYYPYDDNSGSPQGMNPLSYSFAVLADQSGNTVVGETPRSNYNLSDMLAAKNDNSGAGYGKTYDAVPISLTFKHMMALVQVEVFIKDLSLYDADIEMKRVDVSASLNLGASGGPAVTAGGSGSNSTVKLRRVEQEGDDNYATKFTFRAMLPAQTLESGIQMFHIQYRDNLFASPRLDAELELEAGTAFLYKHGSLSGIYTAEDLVALSAQWKSAFDSDAEIKKAQQEEVFSDWSDDGTPEGVIRVYNDIDMSDIDNFDPIGIAITSSYTNDFTGKFDGGGHTISNLKVDVTDITYQAGLFGGASGAVISNINIKDCDIKVYSIAGGIVASPKASIIAGCSVTGGTISVTEGRAGGIVGYGTNSSVIIGCSMAGTTVTANSDAGGIAGIIHPSKIIGCLVTGGTITASSSSLGGITGSNAAGSLIAGCVVVPGKFESVYTGGVITGSSYGTINTVYWVEMDGLRPAPSSGTITDSPSFDRDDKLFFITSDGTNTPVGYMNELIEEEGYDWRWKPGNASTNWLPVTYLP